MAQFFFEIADDEETNTEVIADADDVAVDFREERELQHDDLRDAVLNDDLLEIIGIAENGNAVLGLGRFVHRKRDPWCAGRCRLCDAASLSVARLSRSNRPEVFFLPARR